MRVTGVHRKPIYIMNVLTRVLQVLPKPNSTKPLKPCHSVGDVLVIVYSI